MNHPLIPTINNPTPEEAVDKRHLHIDSFVLQHPRTQAPNRFIRVTATTFGFDSTGKRKYDSRAFEEQIDDFDPAFVQAYCIKHQKTPEQAITTLIAARAKLMADYNAGVIDEMYLMAAFEMGISKVVETLGIFDIAGLDD